MTIQAHVVEEAKRLTSLTVFKDWLAEAHKRQPLKSGGLVAVNNSFEFRKTKTTKSGSYLAFPVGSSADVLFPPVIASGIRLNADFKYLPPGSTGISKQNLQNLSDAIRAEKADLGELLFLLIGEIDDSVVLTEPINHASLKEMSWEPKFAQVATVVGPLLRVSRVDDEDAVWHEVEAYFQASAQAIPAGLRHAVGATLDKLQEQAVATLTIPKPRQTLVAAGMTDQIVAALKQQLSDYDGALAQLQGSSGSAAAQNDVLRVSYNFASDATGYLKFVFSVCDLKPLVLWGTISSHASLADAFKDLPWTRSETKQSLEDYVAMIADARNSAFHNLLPFRKSLSVQLSGHALRGAELRIFSEFTKRKTHNVLSYRDKPLVDVLTTLSRSRERRLTLRFWERNRKVMASTIELFEATSVFVKLLR
jgi:hypothetical protein